MQKAHQEQVLHHRGFVLSVGKDKLGADVVGLVVVGAGALVVGVGALGEGEGDGDGCGPAALKREDMMSRSRCGELESKNTAAGGTNSSSSSGGKCWIQQATTADTCPVGKVSRWHLDS